MIFWLATFALAGEAVFDLDDSIQGELVRPSGELLFSTPAASAAARSEAWRARRAIALDRRLGVDRSPALLEERADLYALAAMASDEAEAMNERAADLYGEALPALRGADAARVATALASVEEQLGQDAAAAWRAVLAADPASARAHLALGDHAFDAVDLEAAISHYEAALGDTVYGPYATYKLAWTRYNLGDFDGAAALMKTLVGDDALGREATKDLERFSRP